jgi:hypothetical protein
MVSQVAVAVDVDGCEPRAAQVKRNPIRLAVIKGASHTFT